MDERLEALLNDLIHAEELSGGAWQRSQRRAAWAAELTPPQLGELLAAVRQGAAPLTAKADQLLTAWLAASVHSRRQRGSPETDAEALLPALTDLYRALGPSSQARGQLLAWLTTGAQPAELDALAELLMCDPPGDDDSVVQALAPLFQHRRIQAAALFPRLLGALAQPALAAPVLDLANFLTREKLMRRHPAVDRVDELKRLLGQVVQSLLSLEESPQSRGESPLELSRRVARGVELAVSLCDALALIGERGAVGKLYQALEVRHRRLRTEAAYALARLGQERGRDALVELAAEPVARLRVLAYAQELGLADRIPPQYATPVARAEAELCVWLAEPTQYGIPPASCELFDQRRQHWPGYADPVDCFLFRFQYVVTIEGQGERSFSNIGIAGPLTCALVADLGDLPPDDIYAAFAGWQAQHAEIKDYDVERLSAGERPSVERLARRLSDEGFTRIEPQRMGYFFGERALVAAAERQGAPGVAVADFQGTTFFPRRASRPLGPEEAYCIYKGRKLLQAFNR
jgi:hypothetical protein